MIGTTNIVRQYVNPGAPGKPVLSSSSYDNDRLTTKKIWTYTWTEAKAANGASAIKGYRIRVYKNGTVITGLALGSNRTIVAADNDDYWIDIDATECSIKIDPVSLGFIAGDKIKIGIYAFTKNAKDTKLFNGGGSSSAQVDSAELAVETACALYVKAKGAWHAGTVSVKANGKWHEAKAIYVKANGEWKSAK